MYKYFIFLLIILFSLGFVNATNPIAEYRFSETGPYGDNLDNIFDYTLNGHTGKALGNVSYTGGIFASGLLFENQYSYITIPDHVDFTFSNGLMDYDYSISIWVKAPVYKNVVFLSKGHFTVDHEYSCYVGSTGRIMFYMKDNSFAHGAFKYGLTRRDVLNYTNEYLNVVITHGPLNKINIFVNGEYWETDEGLGENYTAMQNGLDNVTIGQVNSFSNSVYIDEVIIWDSYLTDIEILDLYRKYRPETYTISIMNRDLFTSKGNFSLYENHEYIGTYNYEDNINITDMRTYTIVIHETGFDQISHIENINSIAFQNITYIIYILIFMGILGLIKYYYRKF